VQQARARMLSRVTGFVTAEIDRVGHIRSRPALADPSWLIDNRAEELTRWVARGAELIDHRVERAGLQIAELAGQLRALSPKRTLERGYAIAQRADGAILRAAEAAAGDALTLTLSDGTVDATVSAARKA
jgi:exodeoxyribonuclease VII large subunit